MDQKKYCMPRYLDQPMKIFLWTVDEVAAFCVPFFISMFVFHHELIGIFIGAACLMLVKRLKGENGHYFLMNLAYWHLPQIVRFRVIPPSFIRSFRG